MAGGLFLKPTTCPSNSADGLSDGVLKSLKNKTRRWKKPLKKQMRRRNVSVPKIENKSQGLSLGFFSFKLII